jgi:hypothetical protein
VSILLAFLATLGNQDVTPNAVNWANVSGASPQANANQTVDGCSRSITISASASGGNTSLYYRIASGSYVFYSAPFSINALAGQALNWRVNCVVPGSAAGTVTVTNDSDGSATLDTFTYSVTLAP